MLKKLFIVNTEEDRPWLKVILWWEDRRLLYNVLLLVLGLLALIILSLIVKDLWTFFSPPIFLFIKVAVFLILANVFYTSGWVFQLLTRKSNNRFIKKVTPKIFIYGIVFSFLIQLIPSIGAATYTIVTGERIKSRYADFAKDEPKKEDLAGEYELSEESIQRLQFPESLIQHMSYRLKPDMTFEFNYFPQHKFRLLEYEIVSAKGTWKVEKDQGSWVIPMNFDTIVNVITGEVHKGGIYYGNGFHVNKEEPPYEIFEIIGDPDSWEGITLIKKN